MQNKRNFWDVEIESNVVGQDVVDIFERWLEFFYFFYFSFYFILKVLFAFAKQFTKINFKSVAISGIIFSR